MEISRHIDTVEREGARLASAAAEAGLDEPVTYCPGWDMRELLRHLSEIHLWAAANVATRAFVDDVPFLEQLEAMWPGLAVFWPDDRDLIDYYLATNANLVRELRAAPADLKTWTFLPAPSDLAMWARRQAHETAIHRIDAESARDSYTPFDPAFASDGIDEILMLFAPRAKELPIDSTVSMGVHPTDVDERWTVTMGPNGIDTVPEAAPADLTLMGTAHDLYLAVWNRGDDSTIEMEGDLAVLTTWRERHRSRWPRTRDADDARAAARSR